MSEMKRRIINFLRSLEQECSDCLRRHYCDNCHIKTAKTILSDLRRNNVTTEVKPIDISLPNRIRIIMECLEGANKPLLSKEIFIPNCSKELKEWTINNLLSRHKIRRRRRENSSFYEYFLPNPKRMNKNG
jgi:hypothetical protein